MSDDPSPLLDRIHHIAVTVADLEQGVNWYCSSFVCEVVTRDRTSAVLKFANVLLTLTLPSISPPHVAFEKADAASYGELRARTEGVRSTFVADPTGNVVEIVLPSE